MYSTSRERKNTSEERASKWTNWETEPFRHEITSKAETRPRERERENALVDQSYTMGWPRAELLQLGSGGGMAHPVDINTHLFGGRPEPAGASLALAAEDNIHQKMSAAIRSGNLFLPWVGRRM